MRGVLGLDIGSTTTKAVLIDWEQNICGQSVITSGGYFEDRAEMAMQEALADSGWEIADLAWITATGYGRLKAPRARQTLTELSCHARGAYYHVPRRMTVVDIGGQDNKIIAVDDNGRRGRSKMNRKCAAGTGAFIDNTAKQLGVELKDLESLALRGNESVEIGSFCTVFAATEIIEYLRRGDSKENIARAVIRAVALRVFEMGRFTGDVVFTGGVAEHIPLVAKELEALCNCPVIIPPHPQMAGALGAALYGLDAWKKHEQGEGIFADDEDGSNTASPESGQIQMDDPPGQQKKAEVCKKSKDDNQESICMFEEKHIGLS
ncbi:MAG: ATPase [Candidatus Melainabacteria bacterium]|nr:ATPase [Candidatus Melainabacteria bacterium]